jgi:hypothetical protein
VVNRGGEFLSVSLMEPQAAISQAEALLANSGWCRCDPAGDAATSMPGRHCWRHPAQSHLGQKAFATNYGYVLEVSHQGLCPSSVLRFPYFPDEENFNGAYHRLVRFVQDGEFWPGPDGF